MLFKLLIWGGILLLVTGLYFSLKWDQIRNQPLFKMGFGFRSWLTGQGMSDSHGDSIATSRARLVESSGGKRKVTETINLSSDRII